VLAPKTAIVGRAFTRRAQVKRPAEHHMRARLALERLVATDLHVRPLSDAGVTVTPT